MVLTFYRKKYTNCWSVQTVDWRLICMTKPNYCLNEHINHIWPDTNCNFVHVLYTEGTFPNNCRKCVRFSVNIETNSKTNIQIVRHTDKQIGVAKMNPLVQEGQWIKRAKPLREYNFWWPINCGILLCKHQCIKIEIHTAQDRPRHVYVITNIIIILTDKLS